MKPQKASAKRIHSKNNNAGGIDRPDLKLYYRAIVIKTWYFIKRDQWNKIENLKVSIYNFSHLIFDKYAKNLDLRKESIFNK